MSEEIIKFLEEIKAEVVSMKTEVLLTRFAVEEIEKKLRNLEEVQGQIQMEIALKKSDHKTSNGVIIEKF